MTARPFLKARWENLLFANYEVDPAILKKHLPRHTMLDDFHGKTFVSLVGFHFAQTAVLGLKIPFHVNFEEVNLRFYVKYPDAGQMKRGVVFIKEIVPRPAIRFVANTLYGEKYCSMPMRHVFSQQDMRQEIAYEWKHRGTWDRIAAHTGIASIPMQPGSEEEFIAEHYYGYSKYNAQTTFEYEVQHPSWETFPVSSFEVNTNFSSLYGEEFHLLTNQRPSSFFAAAGSEITVSGKRKL